MTISEFCFSLNNETTTLHKHPNTSFYPFSFNSPSDIVFRPYNLTLEGKQLDSFICEKRNLIEKEGYKLLINNNPYTIVKYPYAKYITIEEYFAFKKEEKKKMTINELCDLLNQDTNHLKTKGFNHWSVFTSDYQEKERVNCWSFVLEVEKLNDFIRAKRDVVKEVGFELNIIPKYVSDGEWQIIPADEYLEKNKKTTINELVAKLNNEIHSDSFSCNDLTPENSIVFNPHRDRACEGETFFSFTCFICEKRNLVEKEGFKLLISDNGKYLTVDEYLEGKKKKLVNGLVAKLNKETRKKNIDNDTHAFNFNSVDFQDAKLRTDFKDNIVFYPITVNLTGQELDSFICEKRNLIEKEGCKFLINDSKSGKYLTINEYFDLKKNKTRIELCTEFNKEAKNIYNSSVPYPFTCGIDGSNGIIVYPNMICAGDKPTGFKDFIIGAETIVKQHGYKLVVNTCCVGVPDDGRYIMSVPNYLKKSIKEVYDEIEKEAKKRFKECVASCSEFGSKITIYPKISGDGIISNDFIVEAKNKVEKEGYKFVVCYNSKDMSLEEYLDLRKIEKIKEFCSKLNDETQKDYNRAPFSFNEKTNKVYIYTHSNDNIPKGFIIEAKNKVEKEGCKFLIGTEFGVLTVEEYIQKTYEKIKASLTKYEVPPFSVHDFANTFHNKYKDKFEIYDIAYNDTKIEIRAKRFSPNNEYFEAVPNHVAVWWNGHLIKSPSKEIQFSDDLRLTNTKNALKQMQVEEDVKFIKAVNQDVDFEEFKKRWIGKNGITKIEKVDGVVRICSTEKTWAGKITDDPYLKKNSSSYFWHDITPQVKALIGQYGIIDITNLDDPKGVIVEAEWVDDHYMVNMIGFVHRELGKLGIKYQYTKWSYVYGPVRELKNFFLSKIGKRISASISAVILTALIGFNYDKVPTSLSPTVIHEGVLVVQVTEGYTRVNVPLYEDFCKILFGRSEWNVDIPNKIPEGKTKFVFKDKSSFLLENNKISGIIPKGCKVKLCQGVFGKYYFEKTGE